MLQIGLGDEIEHTAVHHKFLVIAEACISGVRLHCSGKLIFSHRYFRGGSIQIGEEIDVGKRNRGSSVDRNRIGRVISLNAPICKAIRRIFLIIQPCIRQSLALVSAEIARSFCSVRLRIVVRHFYLFDTFMGDVRSSFGSRHNRLLLRLYNRLESFAEEGNNHTIFRYPFVIQSCCISHFIPLFRYLYGLAFGFRQIFACCVGMAEFLPAFECVVVIRLRVNHS